MPVDPDAVPTPTIGRIVTHKGISSNGEILHPAIVTRVWTKTNVNLTVFPDNGSPVVRSSVQLIDPAESPEGWFWPQRV